MAIRKTSTGLYVAYFRLDGRRIERSLSTHERAEAERRHKALVSAVSLQRFAARNNLQPATEKQSIAPAVKHRLLLTSALKIAERRRSYSAETKRIWLRFVDDCGLRYMDEVTPQLALRYLEEAVPGGNGKRYNNVKSALNSVFRFCLVEAHMDASPFQAVPQRQLGEVEHHRNLSDAEIAAACSRLPAAIQCAAMLSRWTTQRLETVCRMTPAMFDWQRGAFVIMPGKTARFKKFVVCPIMPPLEAYLRPLVAGMDPAVSIVEQLSAGRKYSRQYISELFSKALTDSGIVSSAAGKVGFHSIRGTAVTWFKEHGFSSDVLRRITGHATQDMEDLYARDVAPVLEAAKAAKGINPDGKPIAGKRV